MIIAVDAMGGDFAPEQIVKGAALGAEAYGVDVVLVGDEKAVESHLPTRLARSSHIQIRHAAQRIEMHEHVDAVRTKKDASVVVAADMVKNGSADAMVSVGNTAAAMAIATLKLGRIKGIDRPAIAIVLPGRDGPTILLDAGAVTDCDYNNLQQFAVMGSIYAEKVLGIARPRVALLSVGEEKSKGSEVTRKAHEVLSASTLNFTGNVEGQDLFTSAADVIVADGFTGNVALKVSEGLAEQVVRVVRDDLRSHPLMWVPLALLKPLLTRLRKRMDYAEHGGAPLLGLNGICIIGHGRSNANAVSNAVRAAKEAVGNSVVDSIREFTLQDTESSACAAVDDGS